MHTHTHFRLCVIIETHLCVGLKDEVLRLEKCKQQLCLFHTKANDTMTVASAKAISAVEMKLEKLKSASQQYRLQ